ncbi:MAG TPA: molybdenum cofactor guanylyltransferase [Acidimicrobiales bacterium]|nr:molybdenum cofactor guanylyltransferase [Acidimicrobiales bacterium]
MNHTLPAFSGAVLAGGSSRRMGSDKSVLKVGGRPMAAIGRDALVGAGAAEVLAVGGDTAALAALGFSPLADRWPGEGPLGGVIVALHEARYDVVVVLACDLPRIEAAAVTALVRGLGDADAAVPTVDGRAQVLVAAYRRACAGALEEARAGGVRRLRDAVRGLRVADVALADPDWVRNVNQPADLERLGQLEGDGQSVSPLQRHPDERSHHG